MQINPDADLQQAAIAALASEYRMAEGRPGTHQSELSYCLTKAYWDRTDPEPPTEKEVTLFAIGFGLERVLLAREETPEPVVVDGIHLSLDTINLFGPTDLKTTRLRAAGRKGEDGFQWPEGWKRQMAAYRHGLNVLAKARGEPTGYTFGVIVVHLVEPEVTAWRVVFEPWELEENWAWLLTRRDQLDSMLAGQNPMPFQFNEEWECKNCRYQLRCSLQASIDELSHA